MAENHTWPVIRCEIKNNNSPPWFTKHFDYDFNVFGAKSHWPHQGFDALTGEFKWNSHRPLEGQTGYETTLWKTI